MCGMWYLPDHFSEFEEQEEEYDSFVSLYRSAHPSKREFYEEVWGREFLRERFIQAAAAKRACASAPPLSELVTCSLRDPDRVVHRPRLDCQHEAPHLIAACGAFTLGEET